MKRISTSHRQIRRWPGRNLAAVFATFASLAALTACEAQDPEVARQPVQTDQFRGEVVSSTKVAQLNPAAAQKALASAGFSTEHATYGVTAYRLIYRTIDLDGKVTTASGLVVMPTTQRRELQAVSYAHGTTTYKSDVASQWNDDYTTSPGLTYAAAGYVAVLPDYLGLGQGPGVHPWMHLATETSASLDMLRASDAFVTTQNHTLARDVLVTGFSQGASSALGLGRALQDGAEPRFALGALAPISGAYDFAGTEIPALLSGALDTTLSAVYAALMLTSRDRTFGLYDAPGEVFRAPYADDVAELFDGTASGEQMFMSLPDTLDELLTVQGRELLEHPNARLRAALDQTDAACLWSPTAPTRLYVAQQDEQAASANTDSCHAALGGSEVVDLGTPEHFGSRHLGSNVAGVAEVLAWFLNLPDTGSGPFLPTS